jgi:hypothetical protein
MAEELKNIVTIQFGSHLYGTSTPESDLDFKAVHLPGARDIILQRAPNSVSTKRPKAEGEKNFVGEVDEESYSLQRFLDLLAQGQTVAIDMLFAPDASLIRTSDVWEIIRANRAKLLTKKSVAFVGYCRTQANKYGIKGSRVAAAKAAVEVFSVALSRQSTTTKVSEIEDRLRELVGDHTNIVQQVVNKAGDIGTYFECCNRKVDFNATIKQGFEIFSKIHDNYGHRARMAENNEGVDWKALSHAVRVAREAIELLTVGYVTFPLINAAHILDIKKGRLDYAAVAEEIEGLLQQVEEASATSTLPERADHSFIEELVYEEYSKIVRNARDKGRA